MNRRNTLNTRLLPLSILISSLVSGGAIAAPQLTTQVPTGEFTRVADGGSFLLGGDNKPMQPAVEKNSAKNPADILLEEFFPAGLQITPEMIADAKLQIADLEAGNEQQIKDLEAQIPKLTLEQQKQAHKDLAIAKDALAKNLLQAKAALAYAEDQSDENKNKLNEANIAAVVDKINAVAPGKFTPEEVDSLVNAALTKDTSAISPALQQKFEAINKQNATVKDKLEDYLAQGIITQEQKDKLEASLDAKQEKLDKQAEAKQAQEEANKASNKAVSDELRLGTQSVLADTKAENADKAKTDAEAKLATLNGEKLAAIQAVDPTWDENTPDIATELQNFIADSNNSPDEIDLAKAAQKAIANAEAAEQLVNKATTEHTDAEKAAQEMAVQYAAAKKAKTDADAALADKTNELDAAVAEVAKLEKVTNPTTDTPVLEQIIAKGEAQNVSTDTAAFGSKVAGGKQTVADKGKIIDSIVTEDGAINLEAGAEAIDTVITQGTMTNSGGNDTNTLVGADGKLVLAGADATHIAKSKNAKVLAGGEVTLGDHSEVELMVTSGIVKASGSSLLFGATIEAGELSIAEGAMSTGTMLKNGQFIVENGGSAGTTTIDDGVMTINSDGFANLTTVKGGQFNLMDQAKATKLLVENGSALIAGQLQDAIFKGGKAIFGTTAEVSGTIDSGKDSLISVYDGADTKGADLNLAGNLQLLAGNAPVARTTLKRAAAMTNPAQFAFKNVTLSGGTVDMSSTNTQLTMTSLAGDGTFVLAPSLYNQANAPLNVLGDATGNFGIQLKDNGVAPTNLKIIDVKGVNAARFALTNGPVNLGNYKHTLVSDGQGGYKLVADTTTLTPSSAGVLAVANTLPVIFSAELSSIQNRLDKQTTSANESGMWINYLNDNFKVSGTAANFDQKLNGMTLGGDKAIDLGDAVLSVGGFGSYSNSDIKSDYQSSGSVKSNSLGAYAQYLTNNGYYLNGVLKANQFKQNLTVTSQGNSASGSANVSGLGVAVKAGKHINFDAMYVSPYAALSTFASGKSQYQLSNGMDAKNQGSRNTTGTLGVNTGYRFVLNNGAEIKPYTLFSVDHDLMASNDVIVNSETFDNSRKGTRVNASVGVNINMTKNLSVGSEVKLSKGKNIDTPITINLGVGYTF
ncbi:autotransporter outer membrane beta-barrel domain-containing protein [Yersinia mollaretii]|uniref:autotransporter outer membrane beta-barrel domain-containing protein n=1 Tax=Yersinia mollaretii TaxID=33060 RepID=UPI000C14E690|nr:autotransporter outer membrane beta-barrel domain-containing protein [Yersinia mollaretii]MDA5527712.1 autotransporter outer membrane beta-barrel domain-containing protein [Yersinia mollaretii]MDR7873873.1 autotransporter outer membrane beta-barrel domain-containing protein [Yersinia mollaretii]PHZ31194.1 type V secretion protein A [Yersinia mollaretii]WQC74305.1 autotransporter outer membrane beta-barrel domain-containing protein [Yersinia mollaretii]